ncbi:MAG: hypothetical protein IJT91_06555 [Clostridia bacterium]|nr:hypothetical protein [Clostridia bacterium]
MDVSRFINSEEVRDHLKETGYEFSGFEAAWLVWNCRSAPIEERNAAWRDIIETYPDEKYEDRRTDGLHEPVYLHSMLKEYMEYQQSVIDHIKETPAPGTYAYRYRWITGDGGVGGTGLGRLYPTYEAVLTESLKTVSAYDKNKSRIQIEKRPVNGKDDIAEITLNGAGEEIWAFEESFDTTGEIRDKSFGFADMRFDFPLPFYMGDILYDPGRSLVFDDIQCDPPAPEPFVYMGCEPDDEFPERTAVCEYRLNSDGTIYEKKDIWEDTTSLEYYPEEDLTGTGKAMIALSSLVKGELNVAEFANIFAYILADDHAKRMKQHMQLSKDAIWLAGLEE